MASPPEPPTRSLDGSDKDHHFRTDHLQGNIAHRSIRGGAVTLMAQAVKVSAQFGTIILLARLLTPDQFGIFAMVTAFLTVLELFKDLGLSSATVQRPTITDREVSTLFWLNAGLGTVAALLLAASAPLLARFYGAPELTTVTPVVALTLVLTGAAAQHLALLRRQMRFTALAVTQSGAEIIAMCAAVLAAIAGFGIWSLVVQRLTWAGAIAIGAWSFSGWRPGPPGRIDDIRALVSFGGRTTAAMLLGRFADSFDKMLIGWYWGAAPLGLFERSQKLILMPIRNVNMPLASVALPMLSRLSDDPARYRRAYLKVTERVAMMIAPAAGLVIGGALPLVELILGDKWQGAAPILAWLGLTAVYMPATYTLSWIYMSQDRTQEMLRASVVNIGISVTALLIAVRYGPAAVAAAYALSGALLRAPILFHLAGRRGPVSRHDLMTMMVLPALAAAAAAVGVAVTDRLAVIDALPGIAQVAVLAAVACAVALILYAAVPRGRRALAETLRLPRLLLEGKVQQA